MSVENYSENGRDSVEVIVRDEEVIAAFISELESEEKAEEMLEQATDANVVKACINYELLHPYDGDDFINYLTLGEEVTARTTVEVQYLGQREMYKGNIRQTATSIFDPETLID